MKDFIKQFIEAHFNAEFDNIDKSAKVVITLSDLIERDKNIVEKIIEGVQKYIDMHTNTTPSNNTHTREDADGLGAEWLNTKEVLEFLKISTSTLWRWRKKNLIVERKIERENRYNRAELEKLIESNRM